MTSAGHLRHLLQSRAGSEIPGCQDAIGARLIEACGFAGAYISSFSIAASKGVPDVGVLPLTEIAQCVEGIARAVKIPVIVDADAGHGSILNVRESVRRFEFAGAAGLHIEDQVKPRRVMNSKQLIPVAEMQEKIAAAAAARTDPAFQIIGRTDASATPGGLQEALCRAQAYEEAGADAIIVMYLTRLEDIHAAAESVGVPLVVALTETIRPVFPSAVLREAGVAMIMWALGLTLVAAAAMKRALTTLRQCGDPGLLLPEMMEVAQLNRILGYDDFLNWERDIREKVAEHGTRNALAAD
jgi:methylisocitrate lyase